MFAPKTRFKPRKKLRYNSRLFLKTLATKEEINEYLTSRGYDLKELEKDVEKILIKCKR